MPELSKMITCLSAAHAIDRALSRTKVEGGILAALTGFQLRTVMETEFQCTFAVPTLRLVLAAMTQIYGGEDCVDGAIFSMAHALFHIIELDMAGSPNQKPIPPYN